MLFYKNRLLQFTIVFIPIVFLSAQLGGGSISTLNVDMDTFAYRLVRTGTNPGPETTAILNWIEEGMGKYSVYGTLKPKQQKAYKEVLKEVVPILKQNDNFWNGNDLDSKTAMIWAIWDISRWKGVDAKEVANKVVKLSHSSSGVKAHPAWYLLNPTGRKEFESKIGKSFKKQIANLRAKQKESLLGGLIGTKDIISSIGRKGYKKLKDFYENHPLSSRISADLLILGALNLPFYASIGWDIGNFPLQASLAGLISLTALTRAEMVVDKYLNKILTTPNYYPAVKPSQQLLDKGFITYACGGVPPKLKETIEGNPGLPVVILTFEDYSAEQGVKKFITENKNFIQEHDSSIIHLRVPKQWWFKRGNLHNLSKMMIHYITPLHNGKETGFESNRGDDPQLVSMINNHLKATQHQLLSEVNPFANVNLSKMVDEKRVTQYYKVEEGKLVKVSKDEMPQDFQYVERAKVNDKTQRVDLKNFFKFWSKRALEKFHIPVPKKLQSQTQIYGRPIKTDWNIVGKGGNKRVVVQDWMEWESTNGEKYIIRRTKVAFDQIIGDLKTLASRKYRFVMDEDNVIPEGAAMRMLQILEHPVNQPVVSYEGKRPVLERGMAAFGAPVTVDNPGVSAWAEFGARSRFVGIPYLTGYADQFKELFSLGKLAENIKIADEVQRNIGNRKLLSEDLVVASLLHMGFSRTQANLLLDYIKKQRRRKGGSS